MKVLDRVRGGVAIGKTRSRTLHRVLCDCGRMFVTAGYPAGIARRKHCAYCTPLPARRAGRWAVTTP